MTHPARTPQYTKPERTEDAPEFTVDALEGVSRVLLSGDTHGDIDHVHWLIQRAQTSGAQAVFVLGDFGVWDHLDRGAFTSAVSDLAQQTGMPVFFLPGNHENYDLLFAWEATKPRTKDGFLEVRPGLFYSPRGHRWTWGGVRFMSLGGAYSVDKHGRVQRDQTAVVIAGMHLDQGRILREDQKYALQTGQLSWWRQEEISQEELDHALRPGEIDVLLTHDKPREATPGWDRKDLEECWTNQEAIQEVVDAKKPKLLVHGHLHWPYEQELPGGTWVKGLDCDPGASARSGGTGLAAGSWALLELTPSKLRITSDRVVVKFSGSFVKGETEKDFALEAGE